MKKIIITGGCGFIGSNLVKYFLKKKYFVINIDNLLYSANLYSLKDVSKKNYCFIKLDINNQNKIYSVLNKYQPSILFNLAAETHVDRSIDSPKEFVHTNINGVFNLLESLRKYNRKIKKKIKLVHISTDEVYGDIIKKSERANEDYPYQPSSPYAASKASADHLVKSYIRTYKLPAIISNCSNNYGPYQFPEKLIPRLIFNIINNKPLPIYGTGKNSREWIHVEDHCNALDILSSKGKLGENYNIGSGINLSNISLCKLVLSIMRNKKVKIGDKVKIKFVKDRPGHDVRYALNSKKMYTSFKWKSRTSIVNGLEKTIDWYLNNLEYFNTISKKNYIKRIGLST
jgi:dTDP-glucose 4,6-dehydratase